MKKKTKTNIKGEGIMDVIKLPWKLYNEYAYRRNALINFKPRDNEPTNRFQKFMDDNNNKKITSVEVGRTPIYSGIEKALNILSLGRFDKTKKKLDYDQIYHQYMIVNFDDGTSQKIERNHVVENKKVNNDDKKNVFIEIPVKDRDITVKNLIENSSINSSDFWKYDPSKSNCQLFVRDIINSNDLLPDVDSSKVLETQESQTLINSIPEPLRNLPLVVTNLASAADKVVYGAGMPVDKFIEARLKCDGLI